MIFKEHQKKSKIVNQCSVFGVRYSKRREMYIRFRGEEPEIDALLKRKGFIL